MTLTKPSMNKLMLFSILTLSVTLGVQMIITPPKQYRENNVLANWAESPETLGEAEKLATKIVISRVINVHKGKDLVIKQANEPSGEMRIPTEVITLHVDNTLKGKPQSVIKLFRTGTSQYTVKPRKIPKEYLDEIQASDTEALEYVDTFLLEGDPQYTIGERYLLFLTDGPKLGAELKRVVAPEGRYIIDASDSLIAVQNKGLGKKFNKLPLSNFYAQYDSFVKSQKTLLE